MIGRCCGREEVLLRFPSPPALNKGGGSSDAAEAPSSGLWYFFFMDFLKWFVARRTWCVRWVEQGKALVLRNLCCLRRSHHLDLRASWERELRMLYVGLSRMFAKLRTGLR